MPLPLIPIGIAIGVGSLGVAKAVKSMRDFDKAKDINEDAKRIYEDATSSLERRREKVQAKLVKLGRQKVKLYEDALTPFVEVFSQIKNVDFDDLERSGDLPEEVEPEIRDIREITAWMSEVTGGGFGALDANALAGLAAYGSVGIFTTASSGAAKDDLSGPEATTTLLGLIGDSLAARVLAGRQALGV